MPRPVLRILRGGVTAGAIRVALDLVGLAILQSTYEAQAGRQDPAGPAFLATMVAIHLVAGIASISLYAALLPRHKAGPRLAVGAAVVTWACLSLLWSTTALRGIVPWTLFGMRALVALPIGIVSTLAGSRVCGWSGDAVAPRAARVRAPMRIAGEQA